MHWQGCDSPVSVPPQRPSSVGSTQSGSNVSNKAMSNRGRNDICVGEELKIAVNIALERFRLSEEQKGRMSAIIKIKSFFFTIISTFIINHNSRALGLSLL